MTCKLCSARTSCGLAEELDPQSDNVYPVWAVYETPLGIIAIPAYVVVESDPQTNARAEGFTGVPLEMPASMPRLRQHAMTAAGMAGDCPTREFCKQNGCQGDCL